jgi:hypothetical protein
MGDWTAGAAMIYACPPQRVRAVLDAFDEYGLTNNDTDTAAGRGVLGIGKDYSADEFRCGSAIDLANDLIEHAPEALFSLYEEPAYNWVGTFCSYVPGLGLFTSDCGTCGEVLFTRDYVLGLDGEPDDVRAKQLGVPWMTAIAATTAGTVCEPEPFAAHWDRRAGTIHVLSGTPLGASLVIAAPGDAAAVDQVLAEHGWLRANPWTDLDDTGHQARTDLYRHPSS